jgi:hypothetical protein
MLEPHLRESDLTSSPPQHNTIVSQARQIAKNVSTLILTSISSYSLQSLTQNKPARSAVSLVVM